MVTSVTIDPVPNPVSPYGSPFTLTGSYTNQPYLAEADDSGAFTQIPPAGITTPVGTWSYTHAAGLSAGPHTIQVEIGIGGPVVSIPVVVGSVPAESLSASISPVQPVSGTTATVTLSLANFPTLPAVTYTMDGGAAITVTGLSPTGGSFNVPVPAAGTHTLIVHAGGLQQSIVFTSTAAQSGSTLVGFAGPTTSSPMNIRAVFTPPLPAPPSTLTYKLDNNAPLQMSNIATNGALMTIPVPAPGPHTLVFADTADGLTSPVVNFTVAGGTVAPESITATVTPASPTVGAPMTVNVAVANAPSGFTGLHYTVDGLNQQPIAGATATGGSFTMTTPSAALHTIRVFDNVSGVEGDVAFTPVAAAAKTFAFTVPSGLTEGANFTFTGVLHNFPAPPTLVGRFDNGATFPITGVTADAWNMQLAAPAATTGAAGTRNPAYHPGGNGSVINTPFGAGAIWGAATDPDTIDISRGWDGNNYTAGPVGIINSFANYGNEESVGKATDPQFTFTSSNNGRQGVALDGGSSITATLHVPVGTTSPGPYPADNPLTLYDPVNYPNRQYTFGVVDIEPPGLQPGQGPFNCGQGEWDDATSNQFMEDADTGLAGYNVGAGLINFFDVDPARNPTYPRVQHGFRYSTDAHLLMSNSVTEGGQQLKPDSWPQRLQDGQSGFNLYSGNLKAGTTLGIPMSTPMPAGLNANQQGAFWTMQHYGLYFRDQAGGGLHLGCDQVADQSQWIADLRAVLPQLVKLLRPLRNQHQTGQDFTAFPKNGPGARVDVGPPALIGTTVPGASHTLSVIDTADGLTVTSPSFTVGAAVPPSGTVIITPTNGLTVTTPTGLLSMQTVAQGAGVVLAGAVIADSGGSSAATYITPYIYAQDSASQIWFSLQAGIWTSTNSTTLPDGSGGTPPGGGGGGTTVDRVTAPDATATPGTWQVNQTFNFAAMPHGFMRYDYLPPHNFTNTKKYPLLVIIMENDEGDTNGQYPSDGTGMVMQTEIQGSVNTANFRRLHPCGVLVLHIDQTIDESGQNANANGGGYGDAPDSGGNEQAAVALIKSMIANTATYSIDPTAILGRGSSLGGIAMAAEIEDNNIATGGSNALFSGVMAFSDQLYRPATPNGPAVFEKFRNVGFIACSTPNDNNPDSIDGPAWNYFSGNKPYPTPATYTAGGAAAIRASSTCKFYYIRMGAGDGMPWDRYSRLNEDGGEGTQLWATLFGFMG